MNGGGAERIAMAVAGGLSSDRFDVTLLVHERVGALLNSIPAGLKVRFINNSSYRRIHLFKSFLETIREARNNDIVVGANEGRASVLSLVAAKMAGKPKVAWVHTSWKEFGKKTSWRQRLALQLYPAFDRIVAVSNGVAKEFQSLMPGRILKTTVIYNPIDLDMIATSCKIEVEPEHRSLFDLPIVITAGRITDDKNQAAIISAHAIVMRRGIRHRLIILGDGELLNSLQEYSRQLGVSDTVAFLGFQERPQRYISRSQVFALSSRFEGFALVLAEALACGTPAVSYDCPYGPAEVLDGGRAGLLVPPGDVEKLADAISILLANEEIANKFRRAGLDHAREAFDFPMIMRKWEMTLESLVNLRS